MKIPCKDCISFAICNSEVKNVWFLEDLLNNKCTIFRRYYHVSTRYKFNNEVYNLFGEWNHEKQTRVKINENKN